MVDALVADHLDFPSRSSTPAVPPGFYGVPLANLLSPISTEEVLPKSQSRIDPTSATFTPSRVASHAPRVATPLAKVFIPTTPSPNIASSQNDKSISQAKKDVKTSAAATGLSKAIALQSSAVPSASSTLQPEDFPALESSKVKPVQTPMVAKISTPMKTASSAASNKKTMTPLTGTVSVSQPVTKPSEKSLPPGLTSISISSKPASKAVGVPDTPKSAVTSSSSAFPLSATTPPVAQSQPSSSRTGTAKVLRVSSTPRTETPVGGPFTPLSATSMHAPPFPPSRQPSLASISRYDRPGTPTSEITDNASTTSASLSRANSPPPSKIGSAPVRTTTKSMQKKHRAQKAKERELETVPAEPEPEPEIAPILGRKKKQKKEKVSSSAAGGSTPVASRPPSPPIPEPINEEDRSTVEVAEQSSSLLEKVTPAETKAANKVPDSKGKGKAKAHRPVTPEPVSATNEVDDEPEYQPVLTPASVFQDMVSSGEVDIAKIALLKQPSASFRHYETTGLHNAMSKLTITPEDRAVLNSGRPVYKNTEGPNRIMLTPNGDCVRNLTPEEEQHYLELQARLAAEAGPTNFFSAKHHAINGFTLVGGRAVPNGPPAFFPQSATTTTPLDPVSKIQRDEALSYINQYVLPSLSTNSQLEKALNANALDAEMLRSNESSTWASWGNDPLPPQIEGIEEGILATGLESMTAHFAVGRDIDRGQPLGNVSLLSLSDAETAMQIARKETEGLEKRLNTLLKKNRRLLLGSGH
jgi:hypothetical protein